jgi:ankyrin repeat protein
MPFHEKPFLLIPFSSMAWHLFVVKCFSINLGIFNSSALKQRSKLFRQSSQESRFQAAAISYNASVRIAQPEMSVLDLQEAARSGRLDLIPGGVTSAQLAAARNRYGQTALHLAAQSGHLDQVKDVTVGLLASCRDGQGRSALYETAALGHLGQIQGGAAVAQLSACLEPAYKDSWGHGSTILHILAFSGHLLQVEGGATAQDLLAARDAKGVSALLVAAREGHLDQVKGGATAAQLSAALSAQGLSALHLTASHCQLRCIAGGATVAQLEAYSHGYPPAGAIDPGSVLSIAAKFGCLDQVKGGVSAADLARSASLDGQSALHEAAAAGFLEQVRGGVTALELASVHDDQQVTALHVAARPDLAAGWRNSPFISWAWAFPAERKRRVTGPLSWQGEHAKHANGHDPGWKPWPPPFAESRA